MEINELKTKTPDELKTELHSLLREQFNLKVQGGQNDKPRSHILKELRRDIARIKTILREKVQVKHE
jgi:large subunit ribosomal protein L29